MKTASRSGARKYLELVKVAKVARRATRPPTRPPTRISPRRRKSPGGINKSSQLLRVFGSVQTCSPAGGHGGGRRANPTPGRFAGGRTRRRSVWLLAEVSPVTRRDLVPLRNSLQFVDFLEESTNFFQFSKVTRFCRLCRLSSRRCGFG